MLIDRRNRYLEQCCDQLLRQPDGFLRDSDFDAVLARVPGEDQELGGAVADLEFLFFAHSGVLKFACERVVQQ